METHEPSEELRRNLHEDETIRWVVRPHPIVYALKSAGIGSLSGVMIRSLAYIQFVILIVLVGGGGLLLGLTLLDSSGVVDAFPLTGMNPTTVLGATLPDVPLFLIFLFSVSVLFLLPILLILSSGVPSVLLALLFRRVEYAVTDYRLIKYGGTFRRDLTSVPFEGIQDAEYQVSLLEQLFDVGTVTLDTDWGYRTPSFRFVPEYAEFAREVTDIASETRASPESDTEPAESPDQTTYASGSGIESHEPSDELKASLYEEEEIQWVVHPSRKSWLASRLYDAFWKAAVGSIVVSVIAVAVVSFILNIAPIIVPIAVVFVTVYSFAVGSVLLWYLYVTIEYAATDFRLIKHQQYLGRTLRTVRLEGIHDAGYSIGILGRLFDVGSVQVDSSRGYRSLLFPHVRNPADFAREITQLAGSDLASHEIPQSPGTERTSEFPTRQPSESLQSNLHEGESLLWVVRPHPVVRLQHWMLHAEYAVTDDRVIKYSGVFNRELVSVPFEGLHDAEYSSDLIGRIFGFGDVLLDTDWQHESFTLRGVPDPLIVAGEITHTARRGVSDATDSDRDPTDSTGDEGDDEGEE